MNDVIDKRIYGTLHFSLAVEDNIEDNVDCGVEEANFRE